MGEENDTNKHEHDTDDHLVNRNGKIVTITHGGKSSKRIVAGYNCLRLVVRRTILLLEFTVVDLFTLVWEELFVILIFFGDLVFLKIMFYAVFFIAERIDVFWVHEKLIEVPLPFESVVVINVFISIYNTYNEPPQTPNNIGNNKSNEYQSDDFVGVHDHLLGLEPVGSVGFIKIVLNQTLDSRNVEYLN